VHLLSRIEIHSAKEIPKGLTGIASIQDDLDVCGELGGGVFWASVRILIGGASDGEQCGEKYALWTYSVWVDDADHEVLGDGCDRTMMLQCVQEVFGDQYGSLGWLGVLV